MSTMYLMIGFLVILSSSLHVSSSSKWGQTSVNNRPTIGLLAQRSFDSDLKFGQEYLMSEYVKFVEMAGASVVIVKGKQSKEYYKEIFKRVNGILLPGGDVDAMKSPYRYSSQIMFEMAVEANDKGDYFPIWATCQGFQVLADIVANKSVLEQSDANNLPLPLTLLPSCAQSRLLGKAPKDILSILSQEPVTANFHNLCVTSKVYKENDALHKFFRVMSVNKDRKGEEFVSTMEAYRYPFYAVQWHPEKNIFTRRTDLNIPHSFNAVRVAQYMANFFINEARKNFHKFASEEEKSHAVIENDDRVFLPKHYLEDFFYNVTKA